MKADLRKLGKNLLLGLLTSQSAAQIRIIQSRRSSAVNAAFIRKLKTEHNARLQAVINRQYARAKNERLSLFRLRAAAARSCVWRLQSFRFADDAIWLVDKVRIGIEDLQL